MWGDGKQTRSFTYIDDCVEGILRITKSDFKEPLNLGSSEMVSMNGMMETICQFDGRSLPIRFAICLFGACNMFYSLHSTLTVRLCMIRECCRLWYHAAGLFQGWCNSAC